MLVRLPLIALRTTTKALTEMSSAITLPVATWSLTQTHSLQLKISEAKRIRAQYKGLQALLASLEQRDHQLVPSNVEKLADLIRLHAIRSIGRSQRIQVCSDLAHALWAQWEAASDQQSLALCVHVETELAYLHTPDHPERASSYDRLGGSIRTLFNQTGDPQLLFPLSDFHRQSLALRPRGHPERHISCSNLSSSLYTHYQYFKRYELLDECVELSREALILTPAGHPHRHYSCSNLGRALLSRYRLTGDSILLEDSIQFKTEAFTIQPMGHPNRHNAWNDLATSLLLRFEQTGDYEHLEDTIKLGKEVLHTQAMYHPDRPALYSGIADLLCAQFQKTGRWSALDEAVHFQREALAMRPPGHRLHVVSRWALARYLRLGEAAGGGPFADEPYRLLDGAIALCYPYHPAELRIRMERAELSLLHNNHAGAVVDLFLAHRVSNTEMPELLTPSIRCIGQIDIEVLSPDEQIKLLKVCGRVLDIVNVSTGFALDQTSQLQRILTKTPIGPRALVLATRVNDLPSGLERLERARGVIWSQTLHIRDPPHIETLPPQSFLHQSLKTELRGLDEARSALMHRALSADCFLSERDLLHQQRSLVQQTIRDIHNVPGLYDFMRGPDSATLLTSASHSYVVVLVADERECHALVIRSPQEPLTSIRLQLNVMMLQELTHAASTSLKHRGAAAMLDADDYQRAIVMQKRKPGFAATLAKLWFIVVKPILTHLKLTKRKGQSRPRLHWCPTGAFAFAPVHAAGIYEGADKVCCAEYVVSSYTPTLAALLRAQQHPRTYSPRDVRILAVAAETAQGKSLPTLRYVAQEAQRIKEIAAAVGAPATHMTRSVTKADVVASLESSDEFAHIIHLACHGIQHPSEPHKSHFCLSDGNLTVSELMQANSKNALLTFLSACETAKGDQKHVDEVVHLAATMLFAGFRSVVATMWAMSDQDGPYVAKCFYEKLLADKTIDTDSIAYALDEAVTALRHSGVSPERWATFVHMGA